MDDDVQAADLIQEYEAKIAALERMVSRHARRLTGGAECRSAPASHRAATCRPNAAAMARLPLRFRGVVQPEPLRHDPNPRAKLESDLPWPTQWGQSPVRRARRHLPRPPAGGSATELVEVDALPTHRDLEHPAQLAQSIARRHQNSSSHHRADAQQRHLRVRDRADIRGDSTDFFRKDAAADAASVVPPVSDFPQILMLPRSTGSAPSDDGRQSA